MNNLIPIEGHSGLYKDKDSGGIVDINTVEYSQYIKSRSERKKQKDEIENIKSDINEIKLLLKEILNGNGSK
jgi:hypothetical protein